LKACLSNVAVKISEKRWFFIMAAHICLGFFLAPFLVPFLVLVRAAGAFPGVFIMAAHVF